MKKIFNKEHKEWIRENAPGIRNEKLTEIFNKKFNMNVTVGQIKKFKNFNHISSGLKSCNLPVGSERINKGYTLLKIAEPDVWIEKHRYVYENTYGKIPDGYKIIFADKNKNNFDLDNLILVTDAEALIMNSNNLISDNPDLTNTGSNIAKLIDSINKKSKSMEAK